MSTLKELIEQKEQRLQSVPDELLTAIEASQHEVFKAMLKELEALETDGGKLVASQANIARINSILAKAKEVLFNGDYIEAVKVFAQEISAQAELNNAIAAKVGDFSDAQLFKTVVEQSQRNALLLLDQSAIDSELLQPLSQILTTAITQGISVLEATEQLRNTLTGDKAVLSKYAQTYVRDAFAVSDRQYTQIVNVESGVQFWEYSGGRVAGTRYFCCQRFGKVFHTKEIQEWGRDEKHWNKPSSVDGKCSNTNGGGRNPDTTEGTIFSYLGGYGCLHVLIPVATEYAPVEAVARAKAKGYFKG